MMQNQIIGLINPAIALLFAATFLLLWWRDRAARHVLAMGLGYFGTAIGFLTFHFDSTGDSTSSVLITHFGYSAGVCGTVWGVCRRAGVRVRVPVMAAIVVATAIALATGDVASNVNARIYASNTCYGILMALGAQILSRSGRTAAIDRVLLWIMILSAAQFFIRPFTTILYQGVVSGEVYRESVFYAVMVAMVAVVSLMMAMAMVAACIVDLMHKVRDDSSRDLLTGLYARKAFESRATDLIEQAHANGIVASAIVADIDYFKRVNDIWGHQAGDHAIATFGRLIARMVRDGDHAGRIGGEEFCVIVWQCDGAGATGLADRIRREMSCLPIEGLPSDIRLTASFGLAEMKPGEGYGKLFARADAALYRAKQAGRNCVMRDGGNAMPSGAIASIAAAHA